MRSGVYQLCAFIICAVLIPCNQGYAGAAAKKPQNVLVLNYTAEEEWFRQINMGIRLLLPPNAIVQFDKIRQSKSEQAWIDSFLKMPNEDKPDLIITIDAASLDFILRNYALFQKIPIVFCNVPEIDTKLLQGKSITGFVNAVDHQENVDLALRLCPSARRVVVISQAGRDGNLAANQLKRLAEQNAFSAPIEFLNEGSNTPLAETLKRVSQVSKDSVIYYVRLSRGSTEKFIENVPRQVFEAAPCPVFSHRINLVGEGTVGGKVLNSRLLGEAAGRIAAGILAGRPVSDFPIEAGVGSMYCFDARQLDRWKISRSQLPAGSDIINEKTAFYREHLGTVLGIAGLIGLQVAIIAWLFIVIWRLRKMDKALRNSNNRLQRLVGSLGEGVMVIDARGYIQSCNSQLRRLLGREDEDLRGQVFLNYLAEEARPLVEDLLRHSRETNSMVSPREIEWLAADDKRLSSTVTVSWIVGDSGAHDGALIIVTDLTDIKHLRERIARAEKMELMGRLAGGVAHDLNNVLSGIVSYPDLLLLDLDESSPFHEPLTSIKKAGERAAAIVDDLLSLTRRGVSVREVINLNLIVQEMLNLPELERLQSQHPEVLLDFRLTPHLLNCQGSPVHLSKALMNLVANAFEAMPEGGTLSVSTNQLYLDRGLNSFEAIPEGDYVVVSVSDSGIGIADAERSRIFEPFFTKKSMGRSGTGLGLTVVWGTIKDHNGYVDVRSDMGQGTTFTLYLPVTRANLTMRPKEQNLEQLAGNGERILVVDDVATQREIARQMLQALGYEADSAADATEAIAMIHKKNYDLLVLDMIMDNSLDGLDTYREVLKICPGQKAIITSGYAETARVKEAQRLGARGYLRKPYLMRKLGEVVKESLAADVLQPAAK